MYIEVIKLNKYFNENKVLDDVSFTVAQGDRIGLVGENGSGKTTLFKIMQGLLSNDGGSVNVKKGSKIAYVPQVPDIDDETSVLDFLMPFTDLQYKIEEVLVTLGVADILEKEFGHLSGGQKTKVYLARIALHDADVLLLDEPTNHLDEEGLEWLENFIKRFKGAMMIISHDRFFLDQTVKEILELKNGEVESFGGNFTLYQEQKRIQKEAYANQYETQQKEMKRLKKSSRERKEEGNKRNADRTNLRDNDKFGVNIIADRASQKAHRSGKSMEVRMDRTEVMDKPEKDSALDMYFTPSGAQNSNVVWVRDLKVGFDETLFTVRSLDITYGDRISLKGQNGSGKTTLIKNILKSADHDEIKVGPGVKIGYLSQDHSGLVLGDTAIDLLTSIEGVDKTAAYKVLSQIKIPPEQMKQELKSFSEGQKTKLLLAKIMAEGANFIILDEPTNHLDFEAIDIIESAIRDFPGTLLVVSHDRYFLKSIGITKYLYIEGNKMRESLRDE